MAERRFPRADADFSAWAVQYYEAVEKWWDDHGLDPLDLKPLQFALEAWKVDYPAHVAAQAAAQAARQTKDAARAGLERQIRPVSAFIQSYFSTTDAERATIGITVRDAAGRRAVAPTSRPLLIVSAAARLTHELRLVDEDSPTRRARPRGAERAELFVALTPAGAAPPADLGAFRYVQSVSDGSAVLSFEAAQGGLQAHYLARWVTRGGATGPWSDTASATVAA